MPQLLVSEDWARSVQSLVRGRWRQIEGIRDFYDMDNDCLALLLVLAGRTIDLKMGVPHGDAPFCPRTFVLAVSAAAHKLFWNEWYPNELGALFFDVPCEMIDLYERGICELLHAHSSLYVSCDQRAACIDMLRQRGLIQPEPSPSNSRSSTPPMPPPDVQPEDDAWAPLDGVVNEPQKGNEGAVVNESDAEVVDGAFDEIEVEGLLSAFLNEGRVE